MNRFLPSQNFPSGRSFTPSQPTEGNQDRPRRGSTTTSSREAGDHHYAHGPVAPVSQSNRATNMGSHNPVPPNVKPKNESHQSIPHAPAPPASQPKTDQSFSKRRRLLKPAANASSAPQSAVNAVRYQSPTDFINDFDREIMQADKIEKRLAAARVARSNGGADIEEALCEETVNELLQSLDDILAPPTPDKTRPRHKRENVVLTGAKAE